MRLFIIITLIFSICSCSQNESIKPVEINDTDTSITNTPILSTQYTEAVFTEGIEGPFINQNNEIYVVNFMIEGNIGIIDTNGAVSEFAYLPVHPKTAIQGIGNSIQKYTDSTLIIADYVNHIIWELNIKTKKFTIFCEEPKMNQPNDLTINSKGFVFASDPRWADSTGNLWLISPNGKSKLLEKNMGTTNGVCLSKDEKTLYVNESIQRKVWAYDVSELGEISNKRLVHQFKDAGLDGMKSLANGNILIARYGAGEIIELDSKGMIFNHYKLIGNKPTNITITSNEKIAYITLQDKMWVEKVIIK